MRGMVQARSVTGSERGVILPLTALAIVVLFLFVGLAIDLGLYSVELSSRERTVEQIALGALRRYVSLRMAAMPVDSQIAYNAALDHANALAQFNIQPLATTYLRPGVDSDLWTVSDYTASNTTSRLIPGQWLQDTPANQSDRSGYCSTTPVAGKGCFKPITDNPLLPDEPINAFYVAYRTPPTMVLQILFNAGLLPQYQSAVSAEAYATLVPRQGVFIIDVSRSVVDDTHFEAPVGATPAAEYGYGLDPAAGASCADGAQPAPDGSQIDPSVQASFLNLPLGPRGGSDPDTLHYKTDYQCFDAPVNASAPYPPEPRYAIDMQTNPQPLTGILAAVNQALTVFVRRGVSDDRVSIMGIDDADLGTPPNPPIDPTANARMLMLSQPNSLNTTSQFYTWLSVNCVCEVGRNKDRGNVRIDY